MPELTLKCEDLLPPVYVTAKYTYRSLVHDGGVEIEIVRVVLASEDGTPSAQELTLRPFIADMGLERLERLMGRFADEVQRQLREAPALERRHVTLLNDEMEDFRNRVFAALGLPSSWRKDFP